MSDTEEFELCFNKNLETREVVTSDRRGGPKNIDNIGGTVSGVVGATGRLGKRAIKLPAKFLFGEDEPKGKRKKTGCVNGGGVISKDESKMKNRSTAETSSRNHDSIAESSSIKQDSIAESSSRNQDSSAESSSRNEDSIAGKEEVTKSGHASGSDKPPSCSDKEKITTNAGGLSKKGQKKPKDKKAYGFYAELINKFPTGETLNPVCKGSNKLAWRPPVKRTTALESNESRDSSDDQCDQESRPGYKEITSQGLCPVGVGQSTMEANLILECGSRIPTQHCQRRRSSGYCQFLEIDEASTDKLTEKVSSETFPPRPGANEFETDSEYNSEASNNGSDDDSSDKEPEPEKRVNQDRPRGRTAVCRARCEGCLKPNCGVCGFCRNPYLKQRCKERQCSQQKWSPNPQEPKRRRVRKKPVPLACKDCGKVIKFPVQNMKRHGLTCKGTRLQSDKPTISSFLAELDLLEFLETFQKEKITVEVLAALSNDELKEVGVVAFGDRHRLINGVKKYVTGKESEKENVGPMELRNDEM